MADILTYLNSNIEIHKSKGTITNFPVTIPFKF